MSSSESVDFCGRRRILREVKENRHSVPLTASVFLSAEPHLLHSLAAQSQMTLFTLYGQHRSDRVVVISRLMLAWAC